MINVDLLNRTTLEVHTALPSQYDYDWCRFTLVEYQAQFGDQGLKALLCFCRWAEEHQQPPQLISETILHDLNDMHDDQFVPRTWGYLEL